PRAGGFFFFLPFGFFGRAFDRGRWGRDFGFFAFFAPFFLTPHTGGALAASARGRSAGRPRFGAGWSFPGAGTAFASCRRSALGLSALLGRAHRLRPGERPGGRAGGGCDPRA